MSLGSAGLFWKEFRNAFETTGAVAPSGKGLAKALARPLESLPGTRRILEAGPGTGAITSALVHRLREGDQLILCEINPKFAEFLRYRVENDPVWTCKKSLIKVVEQDVREVLSPGEFDLVVSGLPLNNFPPDLVRELVGGFLRGLKPGGVHTFFEYVGIRPIRQRVGRATDRARMQAVDRAVRDNLAQFPWNRSAVFLNFPPAWAYAVRSESER